MLWFCYQTDQMTVLRLWHKLSQALNQHVKKFHLLSEGVRQNCDRILCKILITEDFAVFQTAWDGRREHLEYTDLNFMRSQCREQSFDVFLQIIVAEALLHTALFEISYEWFLYQEESQKRQGIKRKEVYLNLLVSAAVVFCKWEFEVVQKWQWLGRTSQDVGEDGKMKNGCRNYHDRRPQQELMKLGHHIKHVM